MKALAEPTIGYPLDAARAFHSLTQVKRVYIRTISTKVDLELLKDISENLLEVAEKVKNSSEATLKITFNTLPTTSVTRGRDMGTNILGLSMEPQFWITTVVEWESPYHDESAREAATSVIDKVKSVGTEKGLLLPFEFPNDAGYDQNPLGSYGIENLESLKATSLKYDPGQLFQKQQFDGFLLKKA